MVLLTPVSLPTNSSISPAAAAPTAAAVDIWASKCTPGTLVGQQQKPVPSSCAPMPCGVKQRLLVAAACDCECEGLSRHTSRLRHCVGQCGIRQARHCSRPVQHNTCKMQESGIRGQDAGSREQDAGSRQQDAGAGQSILSGQYCMMGTACVAVHGSARQHSIMPHSSGPWVDNARHNYVDWRPSKGQGGGLLLAAACTLIDTSSKPLDSTCCTAATVVISTPLLLLPLPLLPLL
jgi:hypothetical protein